MSKKTDTVIEKWAGGINKQFTFEETLMASNHETLLNFFSNYGRNQLKPYCDMTRDIRLAKIKKSRNTKYWRIYETVYSANFFEHLLHASHCSKLLRCISN